MKNVIFTVIILCTFGCGVDVTDPQAGYFDKSTDNSVNIDNSIHYSESTKDTVIVKDTVEKKIVDTIIDTLKQIKIDTVIKHKVDTLKQIKVDTLIKHKVDTLKQIKIDTVRQTIVDTIYEKVVDTVYTKVTDTLYKSFEEEPRDTTITLSEEINGVLYTKSYEGIVYKNVFYDTTKYVYNIQTDRDAQMRAYDHIGTTGIPNNNTKYHFADKCGVITKPAYRDFAWNETDTILRFSNWRKFNAGDANKLRDFSEKIINESIIYLDVIYDDGYLWENEFNVANKYTPNTVTKNMIVHSGYQTERIFVTLSYMCAYELK